MKIINNLIIITLTVLLANILVLPAVIAHDGNTTRSGCHKDNYNATGLGEYHIHPLGGGKEIASGPCGDYAPYGIIDSIKDNMFYFIIAFFGIYFLISLFRNKEKDINETREILFNDTKRLKEIEDTPLLEKPKTDKYANLTSAQRDIQKIIEVQNIKYVFHFTQLSNLKNIFENGILSRAQIIEKNIISAFSDKDRADNHPNATCCSVSYPNYKMFWHVRCTHEKADWVVIAISTDILLEKDCAFYPMNAASNEVRHGNVNDFKGAMAFKSMFAEVEGKPTRLKMNLPDRYTTNPQAEVLVFDRIDKKHILGVYTSSKNTADEWNAKELGKKFVFEPKIFKPRTDYEHWKKEWQPAQFTSQT